ncbi:hypothetical protein Pars_0879 [Pyrobaculum arsenaticum DSM 13514]|uniref:Uncharacterized protein n=2 Tax=Pyrobaculum TaxID=2276 RepID=A4WJ97_PYRAR|nr:hypothetical protein Pars_0879 [Pyrobaculum arsenaticum DSM 13514]
MGRWVLLLFLLLAYLTYQQNTTQVLGPQLNWVIESNPSNGTDRANSICMSEKFLYVVGSDYSLNRSRWRIEMREKISGKLNKIWTYNISDGYGELTDCIIIDDKLYVVGYEKEKSNTQGVILIFNVNLNLLKIEKALNIDIPQKITTDNKYLYIIGIGPHYIRYGNITIVISAWHIEKRALDLSLIKNRTVTLGIPLGIAINPVTGHIWTYGIEYFFKIPLIIILNENFTQIKSSSLDIAPLGITFDYEGNGYLFGIGGIVKTDKEGRTLTSRELPRSYGYRYSPLAGVFVKGKLYTTIYSYLSIWDPVNLVILKNMTLFTNISDIDFIWKIVPDKYGLYIVTSVNKSGDYRWLIAFVSLPVNVKVLVKDSFNNTKDFLFQLLNETGFVVGAGNSSKNFTLFSGKRYIVKVKAFGTELTSNFTATDGLNVVVVVPTTKVRVRAVDGFGLPRSWPVELIGVAKGNGTIGPVEVLGNGTYTARVLAFGRWFNSTFFAVPGKVQNVSVVVPTALLTVRAVDGFGRQRDWPVEVVGVSRGSGVVGPVEVLAGTYTARVSALGAVFNKTVEVRPGENATAAVQVPTALLSAAVVDGFGSRRDWPLEIRGVAGGRGSVGPVEVLGGRRYVVAAAAFGKNFTEVVDLAPGANATVVVRVPTAKVAAKVVDSFGRQRDWPVEIVGVASGRGGVEPVEVLAGRYVARASAFGREFAVELAAEPGKVAEAVVQVPTAVLNIVVLDDDKKPLDRYVEYVAVGGNSSSKPPRELELLAGRYTIRARDLGKETSSEVELGPGEVKTVELIIPGTAGFDVGGTRVTYSTAAALVAVALAAVAGVVALALRRRRRQAK